MFVSLFDRRICNFRVINSSYSYSIQNLQTKILLLLIKLQIKLQILTLYSILTGIIYIDSERINFLIFSDLSYFLFLHILNCKYFSIYKPKPKESIKHIKIMNKQATQNSVKRFSSCTKIKTAIQERGLYKTALENIGQKTQKQTQKITALTSFTHLPHIKSKMKFTYHEKNTQESVQPLQVIKHANKSHRNIIKFQSKPQQIQPKLKHIWDNSRRFSSVPKLNDTKTEQYHQMTKKQIISLKSIKSIQNLTQSPQTQSTQHILQSSQQNFKRQLLRLRSNINSKIKRSSNEIIDLKSQKKKIDNHNTSIITQTKNQSKNGKNCYIDVGKNQRTDKNIYLRQKWTQNNETQNQKDVKITENYGHKTLQTKWEQASLDFFEQKLQNLMRKAKINSNSRLNLIKMSNYNLKMHQNPICQSNNE